MGGTCDREHGTYYCRLLSSIGTCKTFKTKKVRNQGGARLPLPVLQQCVFMYWVQQFCVLFLYVASVLESEATRASRSGLGANSRHMRHQSENRTATNPASNQPLVPQTSAMPPSVLVSPAIDLPRWRDAMIGFGEKKDAPNWRKSTRKERRSRGDS